MARRVFGVACKAWGLGLALPILIALGMRPSAGEIPLTGYFIARDTCPAFQSIKKQTNPGDVRTESARAYDLHSQNAEAASHYLVDVPGAQPVRRWVAVTCGEHVVPANSSNEGPKGGQPIPPTDTYVLAVSWQPGFCETRPQKPECQSMFSDRFDATNFTLHGLWPQPRGNAYCNVDQEQIDLDEAGRWNELEALDLSAETRAELDNVMPGTQSALQRHEWVKHGSCYGDGSPEKYFADSLVLIRALNDSAVQDLFEAHIGQQVDTSSIRDAFDTAFGAGAGDRVSVSCRRDGGRELITELLLHLKGNAPENLDLGELLLAAAPVDSSCRGGTVDPAGFQ